MQLNLKEIEPKIKQLSEIAKVQPKQLSGKTRRFIGIIKRIPLISQIITLTLLWRVFVRYVDYNTCAELYIGKMWKLRALNQAKMDLRLWKECSY